MSEKRITQILDEQQEGLTKYMGVIGSDHAYIHDGIAFSGIINTGSISAAYDIAFTAPAESEGVFMHWRPLGIDSSADAISFTLYEGDSFSSGTAVTPVNRNRNSTKQSKVTTLVKNATATPTGTIIQAGQVGTDGNPASQAGGGAAASQEIVLKPGENYVLTIVPAGSTTVVLTLFWYEESKGISNH